MRCNLNCSICYQRKLRSARPELSLAQVVSILECIDTRSLWLIGGEVFLRTDLFDIIDYAAGRGWEVGLTSNGLLVDECYAKAIAVRPALTKIVYSLDGPAAIHNKIRGCSEAFELVTRAICLTRDHTKVIINAILSPVTAPHLPKLVDEVANLGVSQLNLVFGEFYTIAELNQTQELLAEELGWRSESYVLAAAEKAESIDSWRLENDWSSVIELAAEYAAHRGVQVSCSSPFCQPVYAPYYKSGGLRNYYRLACVNSIGRHVRLDPQGRVLACGTVRKPLAELPAQSDQVFTALGHFFKTLARINFLPVCARCCKIRVAERSMANQMQ
jgi:MoaA/NifB/PqqE/SkfB family radical SAM enzyme